MTRSGPNVIDSALTISPIVAAGVLSGSAPFGFLLSRIMTSGVATDLMINTLEEKGLARALAEPNLVACPATPPASSPAANSRSRCRVRSAR